MIRLSVGMARVLGDQPEDEGEAERREQEAHHGQHPIVRPAGDEQARSC